MYYITLAKLLLFREMSKFMIAFLENRMKFALSFAFSIKRF